MAQNKFLAESELATLAKQMRLKTGKRKVEVARELGVKPSSVQLAEENPEQSLAKLRIRMIEKYSPYRVMGPVYLLKKK